MWRPLAALAARGASGARGGASNSPGACSAAGPPARDRPLLLLLSLLARHGGSGRAQRAWGHRDISSVTGRGSGSGTGRGTGSGTGRGTGRGTGSGTGKRTGNGSGSSGRGRWGAPGGRLMAALGPAAFVWDGQRIEEEELRR